MDVYKYIESKEIREYLQSLDYQFTAAQAIGIVVNSPRLTLADQLNAYQEIIDTMPDCKLLGLPSEIGPISAHDFLREHIAVQRKLTDMFLRTEENTSYWMAGYEIGPDFAQAIAELSAGGRLYQTNCIDKLWNGTGKRFYAHVNKVGEITLLYPEGDDFFTGGKREKAIFDYIGCSHNAVLPITKLYKGGDILQRIDDDDEGYIVTTVTKDGRVKGYPYDIRGENFGHRIDFSYIEEDSLVSIMAFELCSEEKAEKIRRTFKAGITTRLQDMYKKWKWE